MGILRAAEITPHEIAPGRSRYEAHTDHLMLVVVEFNDGPHTEADAPHSHPHEQVSYIVDGEVTFYLEGRPHHLIAGDMITIPPNIPHTIQVLTNNARLLDAFSPIREDFLK